VNEVELYDNPFGFGSEKKQFISNHRTSSSLEKAGTGIDTDTELYFGDNKLFFEILIDNKYNLVKREVKTLANVFSAVGGFADSIFVGLSLLLFPFKAFSYSQYVSRKLYKVERKKKSKRSKGGNSRDKLIETKKDAKEVLDSAKTK